jgi:Siphovirus Gp157
MHCPPNIGKQIMTKEHSLTIRDLLKAQIDLMERMIDAEEEDDPVELYELVLAELNAKTSGIAAVIGSVLPERVAYLKGKAKEYQEAAKQAEAALTRTKDYIKFVMNEQSLQELASGDSVIRIANNPQPSVEISDRVDIHQYANTNLVVTKVEYSWDTKQIRALAESDPKALPPGIEVKRGTHIRVRIKK